MFVPSSSSLCTCRSGCAACIIRQLHSCTPNPPLPPSLPALLQTKPDKKHLAQSGLDLSNGTIRNNIEAGVVEPALSKLKIIQVGGY